jgi:hypothetical protein
VERSRTVIVVTVLVKEDKKGGKPIASACHVTPCCEHELFSQVLFDLMFRFVCDGWQN